MLKNNKLAVQLLNFLIIASLTAFLGELKIVAFSNSFRFGLGSAAFFFLLLFYKDTFYPLVGFITGMFVTFFRITLDYFTLEGFNYHQSFLTHGPIIGFYFAFAIVLYLGRVGFFIDNSFYLWILGAFSDGLSNIVELLIRSNLIESMLLSPNNIEYVFIVAILRSFFVVGLFTMIHTRHLKIIFNEQRRRFEQVQLINSELYVEGFYIKKLLVEIENVTGKTFNLYQKLKEYNLPKEISSIALSVAQEVHEVKKDNQRILAGLEKIIEQEAEIVTMPLSEIIDLIIRANQKYAGMLKKEIHFTQEIQDDVMIKMIFPLVVIMNNIIANSVEAIASKGEVAVKIKSIKNSIQIQIKDNGGGISPEDLEAIFEPGYTTKYDKSGNPSNGIGLSHVKSMVEKFNGNVEVHSSERITTFLVTLPLDNLRGEV